VNEKMSPCSNDRENPNVVGIAFQLTVVYFELYLREGDFAACGKLLVKMEELQQMDVIPASDRVKMCCRKVCCVVIVLMCYTLV